MPEALRDRLDPRPVVSSEVVLDGLVWDIRRERVDLGEAGVVTRDFLDHTGAVAGLALDEEERVVVVQQYRHPVGAFEWELPAGLLDVDGEPPQLTAVRELREETDLAAGEWHHLLDHYASAGASSESVRVYLARDLQAVPDDDLHERDGEELGMPVRRVPLDELAAAVLAGDVHNGTLMVSVLAAVRLRQAGWEGLRPAGAPWPTRPRRRG